MNSTACRAGTWLCSTCCVLSPRDVLIKTFYSLWSLLRGDATAPHGTVHLPLQQMNIFAKYLLNQADAADGKHNPIVDWIWWAWNDNSGDTGGIVSASVLL